MLVLEHLSLRRGTQRLLEDIDLTLLGGQRVAIIGANGAGKSSFFQLILGELTPEQGEIRLPGGCRVAHMAQEVHASERKASDYVVDGDHELRRLETALEQAQAQQDDMRSARLLADIDNRDGFRANVRAVQLLHGLGFSQSDCSRPVSDFSGGWRIRLNLAQALMCPSDLLLLDEPTNHLDLDATLWLEDWLRCYPGTLLFISHDRDFIDRVATHVVHFDQRKLVLYTGNYSAFEIMRSERLTRQQADYAKQQQRIAEMTQFVERFRAQATKARQAQSRLKALERMQRIEPAHVDSPFRFSFPAADRMSSPLLGLQRAGLGYADKLLLPAVNLTLLPDSRIGLLGPNGAGKTTLIRALAGESTLLSGERVCGEHLRIGYFAQHQLEALDVNASPLLHLQRLSPKVSEQVIRDFLGGFDFRGDQAMATVHNFSGGEKARLALAIVAWQKPNLLLLDEPTNHLDLEMRQALTMALQSFSGAIVVVSHDRHLLNNTVDQFLLVCDGTVQVFDGDLEEYERWLSERRRLTASSDESGISAGNSADDRRARRRADAELRQRLSPLRKSIEKIEKEMAKVQGQVAEIEAQLADPEIYDASKKALLQQLLQTQQKTTLSLETLETQWLDLHEQLEQLTAELAQD